MKNPKAIIFDLDDTLILSDESVEQTWKKACADYSERHSCVGIDVICNKIREIFIWFWSDPDRHKEGRNDMQNTRCKIVRMAFEELGIKDQDGADKIADNYAIIRTKMLVLFPNVYETLTEIRQKGIKLGMLTNGESQIQRNKINRFNLNQYFDYIQVEGEVGFGKPEKIAYTTILEVLGFSPNEVWIVGDNIEWEVRAPQELGIFSIWHNYYDKMIEDGATNPDITISNISDITSFLV